VKHMPPTDVSLAHRGGRATAWRCGVDARHRGRDVRRGYPLYRGAAHSITSGAEAQRLERVRPLDKAQLKTYESDSGRMASRGPTERLSVSALDCTGTVCRRVVVRLGTGGPGTPAARRASTSTPSN
jgi:hypothetical protein